MRAVYLSEGVTVERTRRWWSGGPGEKGRSAARKSGRAAAHVDSP